MLTVCAGTENGIPALQDAWRAGFCPSRVVRTCRIHQSVIEDKTTFQSESSIIFREANDLWREYKSFGYIFRKH